MCWSCCLVFRLCFSPWQLLIRWLSPQCVHAESAAELTLLYIPAEKMSVLGVKKEPSGCKYLGTMCVSCRCFVCWDSWNLCLLCTECHINMLNIWWTSPHSSVITQRWSNFGRYKSSYLTRWLPMQITEMSWSVWECDVCEVPTRVSLWPCECGGKPSPHSELHTDWAHPTMLDQYYMLSSYTWWLRWHETIKYKSE